MTADTYSHLFADVEGDAAAFAAAELSLRQVAAAKTA
jgi:hypothetical protein